MKTKLLTLIAVVAILHTEAQTPFFIKDIKIGNTTSNPQFLTKVNGTLYFTADDGIHGRELWKSDGTSAGTVMVKDIFVGSASSMPLWLTEVNGTLFFRATDGSNYNDIELWKSDGTDSGTVLVKNINSSGSSGPDELTNVNGTLYFRANDLIHGIELWKSDGTAAGTVLVKDILPGSSGSNPRLMINVNGTLFFKAGNTVNTMSELWKSDGTAAGTILIKLISNGSYDPTSELCNVNGTIFFNEGPGKLWKSDGTTAGTVLVKNFGGTLPFPAHLYNFNGILFCTADDGISGRELWKSDGTTAGTVLVKDILLGNNFTHSDPAGFTNLNGTLFFSALESYDDITLSGRELWKSDGTEMGTILVKDIYPGFSGVSSLNSSNPGLLGNVNNTLYFSADDGISGREFWKSDGTTTGTILVNDINAGSSSSTPTYLTNINGTIFFVATDGVHGNELWGYNPCSNYTASITASGATTFCQGNSVTLTASAGNSYLWSDGSTAQTITVTQADNYTVQVTNNNACSATSSVTSVTISALPTANITTTGATTFCQGNNVVLNANTGTGLAYQWKKNGTSISGATFASYTANSPGSYSVDVTIGAGCSATSSATAVTVNQLPTVTLGAITSPLCVNNSAVALSGNPTGGLYSGTGVSGSIFDPATSSVGTFNVAYEYTDANGCSDTANQVVTVNLCTGISGVTSSEVSIYPNPVNDLIHVTMDASLINHATIEIYDETGKLAVTKKVVSEKTTIKINSFAKGIYTVKVVSDNKQTVHLNRIIKE